MANIIVTTAPPVVAAVAPAPYRGAKYAKIYKSLGIAQITLGSISVIFGIIAIGLASNNFNPAFFLTFAASGIWCGVLVIIAGTLGVVSGRKPEPCPITAALIMTIFAAIASGLMFSIETPAAVYASSYSYYGWYWYSGYSNNRSVQQALTAFHAMLSIIAFVQFVIAIVHSAYCCAVNCCGSTTGAVMAPQQTVITTTTTLPGQMPVTAMPGQQVQYAMAPTQYVVQSQSEVNPQTGYQPIQQPVMQNQPIYSNTAPAPQMMSQVPPELDHPPSYQKQPL